MSGQHWHVFLDIENTLGQIASRTCAIYTKCTNTDCPSTEGLAGTALGIEIGVKQFLDKPSDLI